MTRTFKNLGFAILADSNHKEASTILTHLLKQPFFVPEAEDFESFVAVCRARGASLLLKAFLGAF